MTQKKYFAFSGKSFVFFCENTKAFPAQKYPAQFEGEMHVDAQLYQGCTTTQAGTGKKSLDHPSKVDDGF